MSNEQSYNFENLLQRAWPELSRTSLERVVQFYALVLKENETQNLTRLISPKDFLEGHVLDVKELLKSGFVSFPALDLGSGGGVPGLLAALIHENRWILSESEGSKAAFLKAAAEQLNLKHVEVFSGRAEVFLAKEEVSSVVARAVGPVERIYSWIRPCSTWNKLVLMKGPGWTEEWKSFQASKRRRELEVSGEFQYSIGDPPKNLRIIQVKRAK